LPLASIVITASALAVYFAKDIRVGNRLAKRAMQWLGDMSFPLYLFHPPLLYALTAHGIIKNGNILIAMIVVIVSLGYYLACRTLNLLTNSWAFVPQASAGHRA
jgi:peptidoglycan/LPS O-acetylase OafA/YrhL